MAAATVVGFALTAVRVGYDYQFNCLNQDGVWTDAIWPAMVLSNKCMLLALLMIPLVKQLKRRSVPRKLDTLPEIQNRCAVLVPLHQRRRDGT